MRVFLKPRKIELLTLSFKRRGGFPVIHSEIGMYGLVLTGERGGDSKICLCCRVLCISIGTVDCGFSSIIWIPKKKIKHT